jgi:hypothetical protein
LSSASLAVQHSKILLVVYAMAYMLAFVAMPYTRKARLHLEKETLDQHIQHQCPLYFRQQQSGVG